MDDGGTSAFHGGHSARMLELSGIEEISSKMNGPWKLLPYTDKPANTKIHGMNRRQFMSLVSRQPCSLAMILRCWGTTPLAIRLQVSFYRVHQRRLFRLAS